MKIKILVCVMMCATTAASVSAFANEFLSPQQKQNILNAFDDQSSDNIDEGDCTANYKQIACDDSSKTCTVFYRLEKCATKNENTPRGVTRSCEIKGVASFKDVQDTGFEKFSDCYSTQN